MRVAAACVSQLGSGLMLGARAGSPPPLSPIDGATAGELYLWKEGEAAEAAGDVYVGSSDETSTIGAYRAVLLAAAAVLLAAAAAVLAAAALCPSALAAAVGRVSLGCMSSLISSIITSARGSFLAAMSRSAEEADGCSRMAAYLPRVVKGGMVRRACDVLSREVW